MEDVLVPIPPLPNVNGDGDDDADKEVAPPPKEKDDGGGAKEDFAGNGATSWVLLLSLFLLASLARTSR